MYLSILTLVITSYILYTFLNKGMPSHKSLNILFICLVYKALFQAIEHPILVYVAIICIILFKICCYEFTKIGGTTIYFEEKLQVEETSC